jgi:hypothetical protein
MQLLPSFLGCSEKDVVVHMPSIGSHSDEPENIEGDATYQSLTEEYD